MMNQSSSSSRLEEECIAGDSSNDGNHEKQTNSDKQAVDNHSIDAATIQRWSKPFRDWHYYPHHVIPSNPSILPEENQQQQQFHIKMTDVPTIFQIPDEATPPIIGQNTHKWFMSFIGFDGEGYQSFIAHSHNLLDWTEPQLAFGYTDTDSDDFDHGGRVLGAFLYEDYGIRSARILKKVHGKYWGLYGAYQHRGGYEIDPGYQGLASSVDGLHWEREGDISENDGVVAKPILSVDDHDVQDWEKASIYQPWLLEDDDKYYNFYNAKTLVPQWTEQIGVATCPKPDSTDASSSETFLREWKRHPQNPILRVTQGGFDDRFCADGKVYWDQDHWVMIYFGVDKNWTASIMVAHSIDLVHWTKDPEPLYAAGGHPDGLDQEHAHKVSLVWNPVDEAYYMFYCAVGEKGRGIGLITSRNVRKEETTPMKKIIREGKAASDRQLVTEQQSVFLRLQQFFASRLPSAVPRPLSLKSNRQLPAKRPNIILIMADDLGFSDVGCFGSEIETPHIDSLGLAGVRFSQMYNCARCCPSRASLLTGLYPHQAGIGHMVHDSGIGSKAYQGYLRKDRPTVAEILRDEGNYKTFMVGKWHVGGEYPPNDPEHWKVHAGDDTHPTPFQRGFQEHYGTLGGAGSYYDPPSLIHNEQIITETPDDYFYTDKINDEACRMIREAVDNSHTNHDKSEKQMEPQQPFFLYIAHLAPHWPLHAPSDAIAKYRTNYLVGWDELRERRYQKLREEGILRDEWQCSPRDEHSLPWTEAANADWEDAKMATYAAQIDVMDQGIGRVIQTLKDCNIFEDSMVIFLSDNGGCAEFLKEDGEEGSWTENYATKSSDGTQTVVGNHPNRLPGDRSTFMSYGLPWANASNSPFRLFKSWVHEGGISTPFLIHWPNGINSNLVGSVHHKPWILNDIVATILEAAGANYPRSFNGIAIPALEGRSFLRVLDGDSNGRGEPIFWEHQGNRAVRDGKWKLVNRHGDHWELFDMEKDRTELNNLAHKHKRRVKKMIGMWESWAKRCDVHAWPLHPIPDGEKDWPHFPWLW